ncbi:MAG: hypothetical protein ABEJ42_09085 [Halobacteriaceae archaeon]
MNAVDDSLELYGTVLGALLVLVVLGTLAGQPWRYGSAAVAVAKVLGVLVVLGLGAGLIWLSRRG